MKRERWAEIQKGELQYHQAKDESVILDRNLPYWKSIIEALPEQVRFSDESSALDLGCGGCGILLAVDCARRVGVDPLMPAYLEKFAFLADAGVEWVAGTAEELELDEQFDVVFSINAFDHVFDPHHAARKIEAWLKPGGHCVMTMNCHNTRFFQRYYSKLYRVIDHHHPYQFMPEDLLELFPGLRPIHVAAIDDLWFPHAERYYKDVLNRPFEDKRKWIKGALNPFKWPMGFSKVVLGIPPHAKRPGQQSIYSNYLLVLARDA